MERGCVSRKHSGTGTFAPRLKRDRDCLNPPPQEIPGVKITAAPEAGLNLKLRTDDLLLPPEITLETQQSSIEMNGFISFYNPSEFQKREDSQGAYVRAPESRFGPTDVARVVKGYSHQPRPPWESPSQLSGQVQQARTLGILWPFCN